MQPRSNLRAARYIGREERTNNVNVAQLALLQKELPILINEHRRQIEGKNEHIVKLENIASAQLAQVQVEKEQVIIKDKQVVILQEREEIMSTNIVTLEKRNE
jgi:hypothetical protein